MTTAPSFLADVVAIVCEAGDIIRDHAAKPRDIYYKGRIDLVTKTDLEVEAFLQDRLGALLPGSVFLAEEGSPTAELVENTWIIDPIDGTTNFAHGIPFVGTSVALWQGDEVRLGVVNIPLLGECFTAAKGQGAHCNGARIHVSEAVDLGRSLIATGFPYAIEEELPALLRRMGRVLSRTRGLRRCGAAALDLAYIAAGRYDGFFERRLGPWDMAAGWLLVQEAGGVVTRTDGSPFSLQCHDILASNGKIHTALRDLMYGEGDVL